MEFHVPKRVGIFVELSTAFGRHVLEGVAAFSRGAWELLTEEWGEASLRESSNLDGLIVAISGPGIARAVVASGLPCVNVCDSGLAPQVPAVHVDSRAIGRLAASHFVERGFRCLALLGPREDLGARHIEQGFQEAAQKARSQAPVYDHTGDPSALEAWLVSLPKPCGLFCLQDISARAVLRACRAAGIEIPSDVAVLAPGTRELASRVTVPPLSCVLMPASQVGYRAAQVLQGIWEGQPAPAEPVLIAPGGVASRESSDIIADVPDPTVAAALRFIQGRVSHSLSVAEVADHVATSRRWLEVKFLKHLGRGPATEIRRAKLQKARSLLIETDWPLKQVSEACGLASTERLHVLFKREVGMAPGAFRHSFRQNGAPPVEAGGEGLIPAAE